MPLATANDIANLKGWSFLNDYGKNRNALIVVGMNTYRNLTLAGGVPPNGPSDVEGPLIAALLGSAVFRSLCYSKKYARPTLHLSFARSMARYMLDNEWDVIILGKP
jgi:hypothetical protein